jgi:hypothetical protein
MRLRILLAAAMMVSSSGVIATALVGSAGMAGADPVYAPLCGSTEATTGTALSGNYNNLTVSGIAYVASDATLNVYGDLRVAPGACLDAFSMGTVHVGRDVVVGSGATLALGCAPGSNGPPGTQPCLGVADDTVGGNITAVQPLTMYLTAVTVRWNVVSIGGGFSTPGLNFPVKSMNIGGDLVLQGWHGGPGAWIGALRNHVGGDMVIANNVGARPGDNPTEDPNDSTEVVGNTVGGSLICLANTPPAHYGDAYDEATGNGPNTVGRRAIGECAGLTTPPANT